MKKKIHLHIGAPKTGTTSVQKFIHDHADELARNDFFVPPGLHAELPLTLLDEHFRKHGHAWLTYWPVMQKGCEQAWSEVLDQFTRSGCSRCIISAENFSELVDYANPDDSDPHGHKIMEMLAGFEVRVVVYLRPIAAYVESMYKERIKNSAEIRSCENLLCSWQKNGSSYFHPTKYLDYFARLFGRDNLVIRKYSRAGFPQGDIVRDFFDAINCPFPSSAATVPLHENMSIPDRDVRLKRLFNVVGIQDNALNQTISRHLIRSHSVTAPGGSRRDCSFSTLQEAIDTENRNVLERYGVDIGDGKELQNLDAMPEGGADAFLISLLARMDSLEKRLKESGSDV